MRRSIAYLAATFLFATACAHEIHAGAETGVTFLPKVVAVGGSDFYEIPLRVADTSPASLDSAARVLVSSLPMAHNSSFGRGEVCVFTSLDSMDSNLSKCMDLACEQLDSVVQDPGCGFMVRTFEWVQINWLGGLCRTSSAPPKGKLANWFFQHEISDCSAMSALVAAQVLAIMVGKEQRSDLLMIELRHAKG